MNTNDFPPLNPLAQALWVHFSHPNEQARVFCIACELREVFNPDAKLDPAEHCLRVLGMTERDIEAGKGEIGAELIIPCRYVSYVGLGPEIKLSKSDGEVKRFWIVATAPPIENAMSVEAIRATIRELSDPTILE